jgi:PAS domain S-box-containing protein
MASPLGSVADLAHKMAQGLLIIGADGRLLLANAVAERLLGVRLPVASAMDAIIAALGPAAAGLGALPPGQRQVVLVSGRTLEVEHHPHGGGGRLWLITDQTAVARLHAQLVEGSGLLAFSHEAFLIVDPRGYIRYANQPCERERGYAEHALTGQHLRDLERWCSQSFEGARQPDEEEVALRLVQVVQSGGSLRYHAYHQRADGGEIPVEVTLRPHRLANEQVVLLVARDESRRMLHLQAVMSAKAEAEAANRAKSAFLAITSHELRTPLTGIIGFCELMTLEMTAETDRDRTPAPGDPRAMAKYAKLIHESSQSLMTIINDVVDLSKIEARTLELRLGRIDPGEAVGQAVRMWLARAATKGLRLRHLPPDGPSFLISADPNRLRQMLDNLLSNALKFSDAGEVTIQVRYQNDTADIAVADQGVGVPRQAREFIFDAFWQADDHHTRANGGSGLGLYITRALAEMQGGRAWLERTGDEGSEFRIRLPREGTQPSIRRRRIVPSGIWGVGTRPPGP